MNLKHSSLCGLVEFHKMNLAAIIKPNNNKIKTKFRFFLESCVFMFRKGATTKKEKYWGENFRLFLKYIGHQQNTCSLSISSTYYIRITLCVL